MKLYNHISPGLSELEKEMVKHIPSGGNWQNIPDTIPSDRLVQIRRSGGRTTYYGRLVWNKPSFTITTYFNRLGNGCNLHPEQERIISIREGARLQSFKDDFIFYGTNGNVYKQIGNAVPPLLARVIAGMLKPYLQDYNFIDLFAGAGGMSEGFIMENFNLVGANEFKENLFISFQKNHKKYDIGHNFILGDVTQETVRKQIISLSNDNKVNVIIGGPPCQGFSSAGWRDPNDNRNILFKEFVTIVKEIRPDFFVMENVPGILTMRGGAAIKEIIEEFTKIKYFVNPPFKLKAENYGVPQKRNRVFIIGSKNNIVLNKPSILFAENSTHLPAPVTVFDAIGSLPKLGVKDGLFEVDVKCTFNSPYEKLMGGKIGFETFYKEYQKKIIKKNNLLF